MSLLHSFVSAAPPNFQDHVLPIFKKHCLGCHNADESEAGLDLSSSKAALDRFVRWQRAESRASRFESALSVGQSPRRLCGNAAEKPKLPDAELKTIREWIAGGLIATAGGKSNLREVTFDISAGSMQRPDVPAFPEKCAGCSARQNEWRTASSRTGNQSVGKSDRRASGHRQVLLYGSKDASGKLALMSEPSRSRKATFTICDFSRNGDLLIAAGGSVPSQARWLFTT